MGLWDLDGVKIAGAPGRTHVKIMPLLKSAKSKSYLVKPKECYFKQGKPGSQAEQPRSRRHSWTLPHCGVSDKLADLPNREKACSSIIHRAAQHLLNKSCVPELIQDALNALLSTC